MIEDGGLDGYWSVIGESTCDYRQWVLHVDDTNTLNETVS